jgi:hypothetical protein
MSTCRRLSFHMRFTDCTCSRRLQRLDTANDAYGLQQPTVVQRLTPHTELRKPKIVGAVETRCRLPRHVSLKVATALSRVSDCNIA